MSDETVSAEVVENRRRWIARLVDPQAKQSKGSLRREDRMCCLGHAVDVDPLCEWGVHVGRCKGTMPDSAAARLGINSGHQGKLIVRNDGASPDDGERLSLPEIAALLRSDDWFGPDLDRVVR